MYRFIIIIFILLIQVNAFTQSIYYDASILRENLSGKVFNFKVAYVLANYFSIDTTGLKTNVISGEINDSLKSNPFLKEYKIQVGQQFGPEMLNLSNITGTVGGLDVTNIADGFAKFLVERTKEELANAFFDRFQQAISNENYKDLQVLFPQTYATLNALGEQIYNYNAYINTLRESFEKDLSGLLTQLTKVMEDTTYIIGSCFYSHPDLKFICLTALYVGNGLLAKQHPGQIIADFNEDKYLNGVDQKVIASIKTLKLLSESIRSTGADHFWVPADSLKLLFNDPVAQNIFLGLIYQKGLTINFGDGTTLAKILGDTKDKENKIMEYINGFIRQTKIVESNIKNIETKETDKTNFTDYFNYYNSAIDLIDYTLRVGPLPELNSPDLNSNSTYHLYIGMLKTGGNIALDINRRNYSSAIINTIQLINVNYSNNNKINDRNVKKIQDGILKYGSFMAAVVQAQNSDDVKNAIEAVALPAGSYKIKRQSSFDVALNAYVGLYGGFESVSAKQPFKGIGLFFDSFNSYGITAPIGVAFSKGFGSSYSLFISMIDIGAIASFRFGDDTTKQVPAVQLKDIISPGLFISYGFPNCPVSINFGVQVGPSLHEVKVDENNINSDIYWRTSLSVCVDIPILNLYTSPKD